MTDSPLTDTYGSARRPDRPPAHTRPAGMSDKTVRALGSLTAALEVAEHARDGHDSVWMAHRDSAWLFDVDGTLVDSNYLHVVAWLEAFAALDRPVEAWRIHRRIGMDSGRLLAELLGEDADRLAPLAKAGHQQAYAANADLLRPMPGSRELLRHLADEGSAIVLATSAPPDELAVLRRVLDVDHLLTATTDADDVDSAKPDPSIVQIALDRSGRPGESAVFVGDAVWDMKAAALAGIRRIGVLSGGISAAELHSAGADQTYEDPADLLAHLRTAR